MAAEKKWSGGGGGVKIEIPKKTGTDFYSGFRKNGQGGVQIEILKNRAIDFYSGFRKNGHGVGGGGGG